MAEMRASIVIRAYNARESLARAVESALAQDMQPHSYEVIIVDDGSSDGTLSLAESFVPRGVRVIQQKNAGAVAAANVGFRAARGEFVTLLDSDDEAAPTLLSYSLQLLEADPSLSFSFCDYYEQFRDERRRVEVTDPFQMIAGGTLWRRSFGDAQGWFRNVGIFPEYELVLRTWGTARYVRVAEPCYIYRRNEASLSGDTRRVEECIARLKELYPERTQEIGRIRSYSI